MQIVSGRQKINTRGSSSPKLIYGLIGIVLLAAVGGFYASSRSSWPSDALPLRIGFQQSPPYQIIAPDNEPSGIAIDIIRLAAANVGIELQWVYSPNSPDYHFQNGDVDLWPIVTDFPYRRKNFYITKPIYHNSIGMLTRESSEIQIPSDTTGKRVAFYDREPGISLVKKLFPNALHVPMPGNEETIHTIFENEADAAFLWSTKENSLIFKRVVNEHPNIPFKFHFFENEQITCGIAANYKTPKASLAADLLREEVRELATNGQVQAIYFKYYLDPENEISSFFQLHNLQRRNFLLTVSFVIVAIALALLFLMAMQLRKSRKMAIDANESKSAFLANMSHEIRTPLNGMISMTEIALSTELTDNQRFLIKTAHESADTLLTIVNDILDFSRIEARQLVIESQPIAIRELLDSCISFFDIKAQQKEIDISSTVSETCPEYVLGDSIRLRQILFNLIGNAIKYTQEGCITVIARTELVESNEELILEVIDTGIGIPEKKQDRIFEAFEQADISSTRKFGGSGLGLSICRSLVDLMQGSIDLESEEGKGSTFRIHLPLIPSALPESSETNRNGVIEEDHRQNKHATWNILLVDDNPINLKIATTVLQRYQHTVDTAQDGIEAVEKVKQGKYDLVLMDIQMPTMDGYEATRIIRKWEAETQNFTPIIALTACVLNNEQSRCIEAGMDGYLSKPLKVKSLIQRIDQIVSETAPFSTTRK